MEVFKALVLALVLMGSGIAQGQPAGTGRGEVFLDSLEQKVSYIASQALMNVRNAGDLVQSCNAGGDCSRAECQPLSAEVASPSYTCGHYPVQLAFCSNQVPACNSRIRSTSTRGYVRLPVAPDPGKVLCEIRQSICVQRNLDSTFQNATDELSELSEQYKRSIYFHMFYGSVVGDFCYFPGRDAVNCSLGPYDPRIRPWYKEAISVVKNLVVLIDNGALMRQRFGLSNRATALAVANNLTQALLRGAVTNNDTISVVGYNSEISFNQMAPVPVKAPSNMTVGLERAQVLHNATSTSDCKIIVLFTSDSSDLLQYTNELEDIGNRRTKLFVYALGGNPTRNNSCYHFECLGPVNPDIDNLLLKLKGFFSFLARSRKQAGLLKPHWRFLYESSPRIGLGYVFTVGMPALDDSGQLVGVAGIDVPVGDLQSDFDLETGVRTAIYSGTRITQVPQGIPGEGPCQAAPQLNPLVATCNSTLVPTNVVCHANFSYSPQLLCCEGCAGTCGPQCPQASPPQASPATSPGSATSPNLQSPPGISEPEKSPRGGGDSTPLNIIVPVVVVGGLGVMFALWLLTKRYFPQDLPPAPQPPPSRTPSPQVSPDHDLRL